MAQQVAAPKLTHPVVVFILLSYSGPVLALKFGCWQKMFLIVQSLLSHLIIIVMPCQEAWEVSISSYLPYLADISQSYTAYDEFRSHCCMYDFVHKAVCVICN